MKRIMPFEALSQISCLIFLLTFAIRPSNLSADVIWIKGESEPVFGLIEEVKTDSIEMKVFNRDLLATAASPSQTFLKSNIDQWIVSVDSLRLEKLNPKNLVEYRGYAEELASQELDPAARNLARRLYLIAATDESLQASSLAGLHSLAISQAEKTRIEMLQFMLQPAKSPGILGDTNLNKPRPTNDELAVTLELVQAIRKQKSDVANQLLRKKENRQAFAAWALHCSIEELDQIASANQPSKSQLSKLLRIEIDVVKMQNDDPLAERESGDEHLDWGDFAVRTSSVTSVVPGFENITEFDPKASVYRDGIWMRPQTDSN